MTLAFVLICDVSGSTQLYETETNENAMLQITQIIERMREIVAENDGHCVKSRGDDTVSFFHEADPAFQAAWSMITEDWPHGLSVHAGIAFGEVVTLEDDIYGNAVNTSAHLSSAAKAGEVLISGDVHDGLAEANRRAFLKIGSLQFKGKREATQVLSCMVASVGDRTLVSNLMRPPNSRRTGSAELHFGGRDWHLLGGQTLTIGRSTEADIRVLQPWVSRNHGTLTIRQDQLEYADHSSAGSVVKTDDGNEIFVHRRNNLLTGSGAIFLTPTTEAGAESVIRFSVINIG